MPDRTLEEPPQVCGTQKTESLRVKCHPYSSLRRNAGTGGHPRVVLPHTCARVTRVTRVARSARNAYVQFVYLRDKKSPRISPQRSISR